MKTKGYNIDGLVVIFFFFFKLISYCILVVICDLVHDVEIIHGLC